MGINIDGARDLLTATDGSLTIEGQSINSTGIGTFSGGVKVGTAATIHSTGQFNIGVAATIFANGNATFAGILTAASYSGIDLGAVTGATGDFSIADKIVHTGDTNTTIRFPSADTFTVETASEERFLVRADGRVSIASSLNVTGVCTATGGVHVGTAASIYANGNATFSGICTASSFVPTEGQLANRNVLINGDMRIGQRATSFSSVGDSSSTYTLDRWNLYVQNSAARFTISQDSESPDGFGKSMKIDCTTADTSLASTDEVQLSQKIEGFNTTRFNKGTSSAQKYTLSFWAKTNKTGTYIVRLLGRDNTISCVSASYTVSDSNWNKYVLTFPADTNTNRKDNCDNGEALRVVWWLVAGSGVDNGSLQTTWVNSSDTGAATGQVNFSDSTSNDFYLTGTQLEVGSVATPFEHRRYGDELIRCQRYFNMIGDGNQFGTGKALTDAFMWSANELDFIYTFPVEMRTTPSLYQVTGADYFKIMGGGVADSYIDGNFTIQYGSKRGTSQYSASDASRNAGASCHVTVQNSAARYGYNAEL